MWLLRSLPLLLLVSTAFAQEDEGPVAPLRKIRFRRPRPLSVSNTDGIAKGRPVPLTRQGPRQSTADLLAATLEDNNNQANDALQSLLATAAQEDIVEEPIEIQEPVEEVVRPAPPPRRRPGVPRRRPRPQAGQGAVADPQPQREREESSNGRPRAEPVKTTERYSHMNEDGSFTFGYVAEDGSFREETRGIDCITRGKYGYIDPEGKRREFTYVSGLPCDQGGESPDDLVDENEIVREDPIDPADRFRTQAAIQLNEDEIPVAARPRARPRPVQARPPPDAAARPASENRQTLRRPRPTRPSAAQNTPALQNLLNIAGEEARPSPTPARLRPRPTPTTPRPAPLDFDKEVDSFTLGRPAITFDDEARKQQGAPAPNFSTELVFDSNSGTFKTELRQSIAGGQEVVVSNDAAPSGRRPTPAPTPAPSPASFSPTPRPTTAARPFTAFASTTRRPAPANASPTSFQPLSFPDPASVQTPAPVPTTPRPAPTTPRPAPTTPRPAPTQPPTTRPANTFFFQPFPTAGVRPVAPGQPATPRPVTQSVIPSGTFVLGQPAPPQPPQVPGFPRPTPVAQAAPPAPTTQRPTPPPTRPPVPTPQIQFGFSPVPQQPVRQSQPFTAFANGVPPQLNGARPQPVRPQTFTTFQQPQQFQAQPQQFQARPPPPPRPAPARPIQTIGPQQQSRFQPFNRPQPQAQQAQPFTVFNPSSFRG